MWRLLCSALLLLQELSQLLLQGCDFLLHDHRNALSAVCACKYLLLCLTVFHDCLCLVREASLLVSHSQQDEFVHALLQV